jgi:hypothetical protein
MDSKAVNREIRAAIRPVLRAHGFRTFTERTAWRHSSTRIDVVNFQSFNDYMAGGLGVTTYSFGLNLAQWLTCIPPDDFGIKERRGLLAPQEWECHVRIQLRRRLPQPELSRDDLWLIDADGAYLAPAVRDARTVLLDEGLAWFDRWSDDSVVLQHLRASERVASDGTALGGSLGSGARNLVLGYMLLSLGRRNEAYEALLSALNRNREIAKSLISPRSKYQPRSWDRLASDVAAIVEDRAPAT